MDRPARKRSKSAKTDLVISVVFHAVIIAGLFYLAARQGVLGKKLKEISAFRVKEEKPPEPPKPKEEEPKPDVAKPEPAAPKANLPPPPAMTAVPPPSAAPPAAAPPPAITADFNFSDGAKAVQSTTDPVATYRSFVEFALRSRWTKPDEFEDSQFVAEVEVALAPDGRITGFDWKRGSNEKRWDDSVRAALASTKSISRPPPAGFPGRFIVRFDAVPDTEPIP